MRLQWWSYSRIDVRLRWWWSWPCRSPRTPRHPSPAWSRDTSGAVLPGVTVEAASPALIEKVRSVVSDGRRSVPHRRSATRRLLGHVHAPRLQHLRARRHRARGHFTASINAELRVGALEETITVTGEAPIVDVQGVDPAAGADQRDGRSDADRQVLREPRRPDSRRERVVQRGVPERRPRRIPGGAAATTARRSSPTAAVSAISGSRSTT